MGNHFLPQSKTNSARKHADRCLGSNGSFGVGRHPYHLSDRPPAGTAREFKLAGTADFTGVIYCPGYTFVCTGGGNYQGSIVAKTAKITGNAGYHYDESLGKVDSDTIGGYQMASWVEDTL